MKIEYKITFELENNYLGMKEWGVGSLWESQLSDALCYLIDQGKNSEHLVVDEEDEKYYIDNCLAKVKKHIGKFDVEAREVKD